MTFKSEAAISFEKKILYHTFFVLASLTNIGAYLFGFSQSAFLNKIRRGVSSSNTYLFFQNLRWESPICESEDTPGPKIQSKDFPETIGEVIDNAPIDNRLLRESLESRQEELQRGIGKRFRVKTQKGFLNVHNDTESPFAIQNICGKLQEGEIVTSIGPMIGGWVHHDGCGGGWSISEFGGWQWLIEIKD